MRSSVYPIPYVRYVARGMRSWGIAVALALAVLAVPAAVGAQPRDVILSADMAAGTWLPPGDPNDGHAVATALNSPAHFRVRAIAVTWGNSNVWESTANTVELVHEVMGRREIPIAAGAAFAQASRNPGATCVNPGVRLMAAELRNAPATIIALGPFTDVACLLAHFPEVAPQIEEIVFLSGRRFERSGRAANEVGAFDYNYVIDRFSTWWVLANTTVPIMFMNFADILNVRLSARNLRRLGLGKPEGVWLRKRAPRYQYGIGLLVGNLDGGLADWDTIMLWPYVRPQGFHVNAVDGWRISDCRAANGLPTSRRCAGHGPFQPPNAYVEFEQLSFGYSPGFRARPGLEVWTTDLPGREAALFRAAGTALEIGAEVGPDR
jgi:hypothetical protein